MPFAHQFGIYQAGIAVFHHRNVGDQNRCRAKAPTTYNLLDMETATPCSVCSLCYFNKTHNNCRRTDKCYLDSPFNDISCIFSLSLSFYVAYKWLFYMNILVSNKDVYLLLNERVMLSYPHLSFSINHKILMNVFLYIALFRTVKDTDFSM